MSEGTPKGAEEATFDDYGTVRNGFIMPDGAAYMYNSDGELVRVDVIPKSDKKATSSPSKFKLFNTKLLAFKNIIMIVIVIICIILIIDVANMINSGMNQKRNNAGQYTYLPTIQPTVNPFINNPILGAWKQDSYGEIKYWGFNTDGSVDKYHYLPDGTKMIDERGYLTWKPNPNKANAYFLTIWGDSGHTEIVDQYNMSIDTSNNQLVIEDISIGWMQTHLTR